MNIQEIKKFFITLNILRLLPAYLFFRFSNRKAIIEKDVAVWREWKNIHFLPFFYLMTFYKEFRNVFYMRIGRKSLAIRWIAPPLSSLYIVGDRIGPGFKIQHGFSTIINAESIGEKCHIYQQVTIGVSHGHRPTIGNNVLVCSGAKVFGGITIGDNVTIGANAVVNKSLPSNCVAVGVPAKIVKRFELKTIR